MRTVDKVKISEQLDGDFTGYARTSALNVRSGATDEGWHVIDELLIGLVLIESDSASKSYVWKMEEQLPACTGGYP
jgi:hypothetical protein